MDPQRASEVINRAKIGVAARLAALEGQQQQRAAAKEQLQALPSTPSEKMAHPERLTRHELIQLVQDMAGDWNNLNGLLNGRANAQSWCGSYEENQKVYNQQFKVFQLQPRPDYAQNSARWPARTGYVNYGIKGPL